MSLTFTYFIRYGIIMIKLCKALRALLCGMFAR
jgi:hypothetical protein